MRLFVGLRPPAPVREQLLALTTGVENARWQDEEQLHVTLRFIGEVETHVADDVALALGSIAAPGLDLRIAGVGAFHARGRAKALWAGVAPKEPLAALHRKIDQALVRTGLAPEGRAYLPHITLARLNAAAGPVEGWLAAHAGLASEPFAIGHMLLFESSLGRAGASYGAIARYPLVPPLS